MPAAALLKESERIMRICNACRYCEGYCGVFPAMMQRRTFPDTDLVYLANLCHGCRACHYACQYAPPHEFDVNLPQTLAAIRTQSYRDYAWPKPLARAFDRNGLVVALTSVLVTTLVMVLTYVIQDPGVLFSAHSGEGAFYQIMPHMVMVIPSAGIFLFALFALTLGFTRFLRDTGVRGYQLLNPITMWRAVMDAARLKFLSGGGDGCNYPDERFSHLPRWYHHGMMYGFLLCFAATTVATFYHYGLGWEAPYPLASWPVVLGTVGGVGILVGTGGLLWLKMQSDPEPRDRQSTGMDVALLVLLFLTSLTGLLLLAARETPAMGALLAIHFGVVLALFLALPYSKFVHASYRFAALIKYARERHVAPGKTELSSNY